MGVVVRVADHEPIRIKTSERTRIPINARVPEPEIYTGPTEFTPSCNEQVALTKNKLVKSDITIKEIPVYKTKNATGGYTIYVAERIDD